MQAFSGIMSITGPGQPVRAGVSFLDLSRDPLRWASRRRCCNARTGLEQRVDASLSRPR